MAFCPCGLLSWSHWACTWVWQIIARLITHSNHWIFDAAIDLATTSLGELPKFGGVAPQKRCLEKPYTLRHFLWFWRVYKFSDLITYTYLKIRVSKSGFLYCWSRTFCAESRMPLRRRYDLFIMWQCYPKRFIFANFAILSSFIIIIIVVVVVVVTIPC